MDKTELRRDPLTHEWTIFSESRALPPDFGPASTGRLAPSPFLTGLERYAPHTLHQAGPEPGWQVRVVPNRLPVLRVEGDHIPNGDGFYEHLDGVGAHEIVIETPDTRTLAELSSTHIANVVEAWRARIEDLLRDGRLRAFSIVKAHGLAAGQTVAHSLSQVIALAVIPPALRRKMDTACAYYADKGRSLFTDLLEVERRRALRIITEDEHFTVFCPYASRSPFEIAIWPRRPTPDFHRITPTERDAFAAILRNTLQRLSRALNDPAWHFTLTTAPTRTPDIADGPTLDQGFSWHAAIVPCLRHPSAIDLATGCHTNGVWPESAADHLRRTEASQ